MFSARLTRWLWRGKNRASKRFFLSNGVLEKRSPAILDGVAASVTATLGDIARWASEENPRSVVLVYGLARNVPSGKYVLASRKVCERAFWCANLIYTDIDPGLPVIARSHLSFYRPAGIPGFMLIDCDLRGLPLEQVLAMLYEICPELRLAPICAFPSGSGFVGPEGSEPAPGGWHIVVGILDAGDASRSLGILWERCFLLPGAHWAEVGEGGGITPKGVVDRAMRNPIQPHFLQRPVLGPGVIRTAPAPVILNASAPGLDTRAAIQGLTPEEMETIRAARAAAESSVEAEAAKVRERKALERATEAVRKGRAPNLDAALEEARRAIATELRGHLDWHTPIHFDRFGWVTPDEMFADPSRYHEETCADPVEPHYGGTGGGYGRNKAKVFMRGGQALIASLAHSSGVKARTFVLDADLQAFVSGDFPDETEAPDADFDMPESLFRTITEEDLAEKGVKGAKKLAEAGAFMHDGLPDCDLEGAAVVFSSRRRTLLRLLERPEGWHGRGLRLRAVLDACIGSGTKASAIVFGGGGEALADAIAVSAGSLLSARVDLYANQPVDGAFPIVRRRDGCLKPKALKAVQAFAPRSTGALLCKNAHAECPHFGSCPVIRSYQAAQAQALVQFPAYAAGTDVNAILGETAGTVGLFMDPSAAVDVVEIPVPVMAASRAAQIRDAGLALLAPGCDPREALAPFHKDAGDLETLAKNHGIGAGPETPEDDVVMAVENAKARWNDIPDHIIAGALADYHAGLRDVVLKPDRRFQAVAAFIATPGLKRAPHHQVAVAFNPLPIGAVDPDAAALAVFRGAALAIPGGSPALGPVVQAFDGWHGVMDPDKRVAAALNLALALKGAGLKAAVVTARRTTGVRGIEVRHPDDALGDDADAVIWPDPLTASDIEVGKLLRMSGERARAVTLDATKLLRWSTAGGEVFAAVGLRPADEAVYRVWRHAAWAPVLRAMEGRRAAAIVFSEIPCPWPVGALVGFDDLVLSNLVEAVYLAARLNGISGPAKVAEAAHGIIGLMGEDHRLLDLDALQALANQPAAKRASRERAVTAFRLLNARS